MKIENKSSLKCEKKSKRKNIVKKVFEVKKRSVISFENIKLDLYFGRFFGSAFRQYFRQIRKFFDSEFFDFLSKFVGKSGMSPFEKFILIFFEK